VRTEGPGRAVVVRAGVLELPGELVHVDDLSAGADRVHEVRQNGGQLPGDGARTAADE
jgi:hypothetical protein